MKNSAAGNWQIIVTEIPYQVQKSRLIERIANLIQNKKLQLVADVRDESAEDVRLVLEPRSRNVDPEMLMEALFRQSDLETKFAVNLNALIDGRTPRVCSLKEILTAFLKHRREVLERRSRHRLGRIDRRVEIVEGCIAAFLKLDRVIEIIRYEDAPKQVLIDEFILTDLQAESILNMRLRSLRKLEELELRREYDALLLERSEITDLLQDRELQRKRIGEEIREVKKKFGAANEAGARRTAFGTAADVAVLPVEAMIEREPITVLCSKMGWIRAVKGAVPLDQEFRYRDGDEGRFVFHAETTDRLILFGSNGRFYTLNASALPGGRGLGEPVRVMVDLPNDSEVIQLLVHRSGRRLLLASASGHAFIVDEDAVVASTRNGKQVMTVRPPDQARVCAEVDGDHVAVVGENGKLLIYPISELPELNRGRGNKAQSYSAGGLADMTVFELKRGLQWTDPAGRRRTVKDLDPWIGKRGRVGVKPPRGFPKSGRFT